MLLWGFGMRTYTCDAARGIREVNLGRTGRCSALPGLTKHPCEILQLVVCCLSDIRRMGWSRIEVQLESNKHFQGSRDHWQCHCPHSKVTICFSIRCGPEGSPQRSCPLTPITRSKPKVIKPLWTWPIPAPKRAPWPAQESQFTPGTFLSRETAMALAVLVQDTVTAMMQDTVCGKQWKPLCWSRDADSRKASPYRRALIQNLHLEFTRDAEQFHLCGQCPCLPHRVSANGISFHGSYTIAAGTRFIKTITWHFI